MNFKSQLCAAILTLGCSCLSANAMVANDAAKENKAQHYQPSAENRKNLVHLLKNFDFSVKSLAPIEEAVVTSGGVNVKEINPKTFESKKVQNLYFIGEVVDVDAYTGGFNLQIAWSSAVAAARALSR